MSKYLSWQNKKITDFSDENIEKLYENGFVFGRTGKGEMTQTRSIRIDLEKFEPVSENRRILRKTEDIVLQEEALPLTEYHWKIGKLVKDFYDKKFGIGVFSANKAKEILTDKEKSNFNKLLRYSKEEVLGYCICLETDNILHYSYPFYDLEKSDKNMGMGMMLKAIILCREKNKKYIYLGSAQRPTDTYKLQFKGLEWFDGSRWKDDLDELKSILKK